jgi:hypothetical protein
MHPRSLEALVGSFIGELIDAFSEYREQAVRPRDLHAFERVPVLRVENEVVERSGAGVGVQDGRIDGADSCPFQMAACPQEPPALAAVFE